MSRVAHAYKTVTNEYHRRVKQTTLITKDRHASSARLARLDLRILARNSKREHQNACLEKHLRNDKILPNKGL